MIDLDLDLDCNLEATATLYRILRSEHRWSRVSASIPKASSIVI